LKLLEEYDSSPDSFNKKITGYKRRSNSFFIPQFLAPAQVGIFLRNSQSGIMQIIAIPAIQPRYSDQKSAASCCRRRERGPLKGSAPQRPARADNKAKREGW